jgi:hypothetical protein
LKLGSLVYHFLHPLSSPFSFATTFIIPFSFDSGWSAVFASFSYSAFYTTRFGFDLHFMMQLKQVIMALCLSSFAIAKGHHHKNGTAVAGAAAVGAGSGMGTGAAAAGTGTAGRKKHGAGGAAANSTATGATTGKAKLKEGLVSKAKNGTKATSEKSQCAQISRLTKLTALVNNATALSELETKHNLTAAEVSEIKVSAANATTLLTKLQANSTLTTQCAIINADSKLKNQCKEISKLTKLAALATNATALNELQTKKNLTAAEMAKIKEGAQNATVKLTKLQSNTTLVTACQTIKTTGAKGNKTGTLSAYKLWFSSLC